MKLVLDNPHRPFYPGALITGHIQIDPQDLPVIQRAHLILEGRAKTKTCDNRSERGTTYRARAPLLYQIHQLEIDPAAKHDKRDIPTLVPFALAIPEQVPKVANVPTKKDGMFTSYWSYDWGKPKEPFQHEAGHALPPTFNARQRGLSSKADCYVEYSITAIGSRVKPLENGSLTEHMEPCSFDTLPFWMQSSCPIAQEAFQSLARKMRQSAMRVQIQSAKLLPETAPREKAKMSFKEKCKNAMSSPKLPEVNLVAALKVPAYMQVGERMNVTMRLERTSAKGTKPQIPFPDVQMESVEIKMKHTTSVRTCGAVRMHSDQWSETAWTDTQTHGLLRARLPTWTGESSPSKSIAAMIEDAGKELAASSSTPPSQTFNLSSGSAIPSRLTPTFSTYNISRVYDVRVTVSFSCVGEKKFVNYNGPITIYSKPMFPKPEPTAHVGDQLDNESRIHRFGAGAATNLTDGNAVASGIVIESAAEPAERIDSGIDAGTKGVDRNSDNWGEHTLSHDEELASQEMAGFAVEALDTVE